MTTANTPNWDELLQAYSNRDCTATEFCARHSIKYEHLQYRLSKRNKQSKSNNFSPLKLEPAQASKKRVGLELPHGIKLNIEL